MATPSTPPTHQSILNTLYNLFFAIHLPVILLVDSYPLYPRRLIPSFMSQIRQYYISTYKDRFFTARAPAWFWWFVVMEATLHVPVCLSVLWNGGVGRGDRPWMQLNLLLFATQTALTTAVCIAEYSSWEELSVAEKTTLGQLYIPYFVFAMVMLVDMYSRVRSRLLEEETAVKRG